MPFYALVYVCIDTATPSTPYTLAGLLEFCTMGRGRRRKRVQPQGSWKKEERGGRTVTKWTNISVARTTKNVRMQRIALLGDRGSGSSDSCDTVVVCHSHSRLTPHGLVQPINTNAFRSQTPKNPLVPSRDNEQPEVHSTISFLVAQPFRWQVQRRCYPSVKKFRRITGRHCSTYVCVYIHISLDCFLLEYYYRFI